MLIQSAEFHMLQYIVLHYILCSLKWMLKWMLTDRFLHVLYTSLVLQSLNCTLQSFSQYEQELKEPCWNCIIWSQYSKNGHASIICGLSISSCRSIRAGVHWKNSNPSFFFSTVTIDLERHTDFHQNEGKNMDWSSVALIGASVKVEALIAAQFRSRKREFEFSSRFIGSLDSEVRRFTLFLSLFFLYICLNGTADHYLSLCG